MKLYKYSSYEEYIKKQIEKTAWAINNTWAAEAIIVFIADFIKAHIKNVNFGICHGVRNGWEVKKFIELLNINVIGTELSNVKITENVINWDFHEIKEQWVNNTDFIYSNAFDHAYDPEKCLNQWMKCLKKTGLCFIEWTPQHTNCNDIDCFGAEKKEYEHLFSKKYSIKIFDVNDSRSTSIFIIKHKE
jgi:hypothetical protein